MRGAQTPKERRRPKPSAPKCLGGVRHRSHGGLKRGEGEMRIDEHGKGWNFLGLRGSSRHSKWSLSDTESVHICSHPFF